MFEVEITTAFSAAHRLRDYKGKCERLHGHNYRVHVCVRSATTGNGGMVIDFGELKRASNTVLDRLDHSFLNEIEPFVEIDPSAENIAAFLFAEIAQQLNEHGTMLYSVSVWESDTSRATFVRDEVQT